MQESEPAWPRILSDLNEAQRRWLVGAMALDEGWGGVKRMQEITGLSVPTIIKGMREVRQGKPVSSQERVRRAGGGRPLVERVDAEVLGALRGVLEESTAGSPMRALLWTHKSTRKLAEELARQGHVVSANTAGRLLEVLGYSLQVNARSKEGRSPPGRNAQFRYINRLVEAFQAEGNPVLSVDCKKKERVGLFKIAGRTYRPSGEPVKVNIYDFPSLSEGNAIPYGVYDVERNRGFVNVGMTHETAEFAVESLRFWWQRYGQRWYPEASGWLVCADGGGSNGSNTRGWKYHLYELSQELGIQVSVCHYPPGTSKWNRIEHRMFSFISLNWQGVPLETYETVVNLIMGTKTKTGLRVKARLDRKKYPLKERITDEQMAEINIVHHKVNPEWNYTIYPSKAKMSADRKKEKSRRLPQRE
jgi:hypothetical protein